MLAGCVGLGPRSTLLFSGGLRAQAIDKSRFREGNGRKLKYQRTAFAGSKGWNAPERVFERKGGLAEAIRVRPRRLGWKWRRKLLKKLNPRLEL